MKVLIRDIYSGKIQEFSAEECFEIILKFEDNKELKSIGKILVESEAEQEHFGLFITDAETVEKTIEYCKSL